ncbi:C6 finger domain protein, putative [Talaromyces stipitatus ATCC 10500]|uniref:C6 finger domain protein, putative n=1 Tax=Talaromyces stipitatus (strain ATCC 10500 / CBS 375.48 / QM 6759 / NRRL 1006) TaxID=441959 RepID=B8MB14_TALSN|nr:C6 finger domain protein, putative [Talaromyces stipitatus ATCC 10500]EED18715.1 C6 finger domain protein, putative [Talaromyces stipitatus ATCC 10500]
MPRPKRPGAPAPKPRSRHGCWPCKRRKIKCNEEKPSCANCLRQGDTCDYSIRLNWEGRTKRKASDPPTPISNSPFVSYSTNFQQSSFVGGLELTSPVDLTQSVRGDWSAASSPYANSTGNTWISQGTPGSTPSVPAKSPPTGPGDHHAIPNEDSVMPSMAEQLANSPVVAPSMTVHENFQPYPQPFAVPDSLDSVGLGFTSLPSYGFESNAVSQPVSFLRDTSAGDSMAPTMTEQSIYGSKRHKKQEDSLSHRLYHRRQASLDQEIGRMSVNELLASAGDNHESGSLAVPGRCGPIVSGHEIFYGYDCGTPDYDVNKNNDAEAIAPISPSEEVFEDDSLSPVSEQTPTSSIHVRRRSSFTTGGGYYVTPTRVKIPRRMTPLPSTLLDNPMNLLYFHHFIDHTARILVPHDCDRNGFLRILPAMAINDPNLLNLMLAYSASHRARFLRHPEPSNRIAHWVKDVFPTLRHALNEPEEKVTDSHLATAIMLLSLKIVSPSTFEVPITWQTHLKLARDLFVARGFQHRPPPNNKVAFFLVQWFRYLDILGSLSCRHSGAPLSHTNYPLISTEDENLDDRYGERGGGDENYRVDCFFGCTPRTGAHLARLAQLTHRCDNERFDEVSNFRTDWTPSDDVIQAGQSLLEEMHHTRQRGHVPGTHHTELEDNEMMAIDLAFHWSAVLHTHRRVLGNTSYSTEIAEAVDNLCDAISRIRSGSSTECSVLFPLFTAGCESRDPQQRLDIMTRVMNFETEGLKQFKNARKLMQRCWEEDLPWMALAHGEFLG